VKFYFNLSKGVKPNKSIRITLYNNKNNNATVTTVDWEDNDVLPYYSLQNVNVIFDKTFTWLTT
jgi:hypothetical protein